MKSLSNEITVVSSRLADTAKYLCELGVPLFEAQEIVRLQYESINGIREGEIDE